MADLPFGPVGSERTPAQWAALHAGIEFLPELDRKLMWMIAETGFDPDTLGAIFEMDPGEVERNLARSSRTLITWERNACEWANRYVAREPWSEDGRGWRPGDGKTPERV